MSNSYSKKYIQIYLWQGISLILNFASMFIVIPFLTKDPATYGIYTVCISVSIFLTYADIGFVGAGQKYAAEYYARDERDKEVEVIGFTGFILLMFLLILSSVFLYLSYNPNLLIKHLSSSNETFIASKLLLILALFTPFTALQRGLQIIFGIRLEDYITQRINIVGSILKILSVLWFFRSGKYDITGYFCFVQTINVIALITASFIAKKRFNYNFKHLFFSIKFDREIYLKTRSLAFSSLFLTISWILYYELDPLVMIKFVGAKEVAIYAIGLTLLSFFRSILGILFSPFGARFNHFIGVGNNQGLKDFYLNITKVFAPVVVIPILTICILSKPLILSWVGTEYSGSIELTKFLLMCNLFAFISYPGGMLLIAKEKVLEMYVVNAIIPLVYWIGILITFSMWGTKAFAIFKLVVFLITAISYFLIVIRLLELDVILFFKRIILPLVIPCIFAVMAAFFIRDYLPFEKSKVNLVITGCSIGTIIVCSLGIQLIFSAEIRAIFFKFLKINKLNNTL